mmetsp:Transcript_73562/g.163469  ORF Transcript_73562/g.163469 Transcript_73562/m.163469 type:complete len:244 (-) Transcript_73562:140-871(-)
MVDPGVANSRIFVKIRESCALLAIPQTPTHPIRAKTIRPILLNIVEATPLAVLLTTRAGRLGFERASGCGRHALVGMHSPFRTAHHSDPLCPTTDHSNTEVGSMVRRTNKVMKQWHRDRVAAAVPVPVPMPVPVPVLVQDALTRPLHVPMAATARVPSPSQSHINVRCRRILLADPHSDPQSKPHSDPQSKPQSNLIPSRTPRLTIRLSGSASTASSPVHRVWHGRAPLTGRQTPPGPVPHQR